MVSIAPGWYVDPVNQDLVRYWDGEFWTPHHVSVKPPVNWPARIGFAIALAGAAAALLAGFPFDLPLLAVLATVPVVLGILGLRSRYRGSGTALAVAAILIGGMSLLSPAVLWDQDWTGDFAESADPWWEGQDEGATESDVVVVHDVPAGWRSVQFQGLWFALPPTWGAATLEDGSLVLDGLELPSELQAYLRDEMDDSWDLVLLDQASVDRLDEVPKADRTGAWREDRIEDLWLYSTYDGVLWTQDELLDLLRESVEDDDRDPTFGFFDHPSVPAAFEDFRWDEGAIDWHCRWYSLAVGPVAVEANQCRNPDDPEHDLDTAEAILRTFGNH